MPQDHRAAGSHRQVVGVGVAGLDQSLSERVELLEEVGGVELAIHLVEAKPPHVVLNGVDEAHSPCSGSCRRTAVAEAAVLGRQAEVDTDRLGVAQVQVAVGLGEPGAHGLDPALGQVTVDLDLDEVAAGAVGCRRLGHAGLLLGAGQSSAISARVRR